VDTRRYQPKLRALSIFAVAMLVLLAGITLLLAKTASSEAHQKNVQQFEIDTQVNTRAVQTNLNNYSTTLYVGRSFLLNSQLVTSSEWSGFYHNQDIFNRFKGMSSIDYVQLVTAAQKDKFIADKRQLPDFGLNYDITPAGNRSTYAVGTLIVSSSDNIKLNGFDVFSTADRRAVYQRAQDTGQPTASGKTTLASGSEGFFITLPVNNDGTTHGFVLVSLHVDDFFNALIEPPILGLNKLKITDVTEPSKPTKLYNTASWDGITSGIRRNDTVNFAGRQWRLDYQAPFNYTHAFAAVLFPYLVLLSGTLLICILILILYIFFRTVPVKRLPPEHRKALNRRRDR
jgi:CHASE1-domain containing sensor protein